ncbi:MAG: hypothetical protein KTU85_10805 [Acidimicrobiia bacterium]|nr:hypothetical protein [Acidimicrobiia bacterium]MCY4457046.1 hypothetical protein [Acidimicrobiaceae bacterium]
MSIWSGESSTGGSRECPKVSSDELPNRLSDERSVFSSDESLRNSSGERSAVSSDEVSAISTSRPDRARTRADPAQPHASNVTQSTIQIPPRLVHGEQPQHENQTKSDTEKQRPAAQSTAYDPVDGIDTS